MGVNLVFMLTGGQCGPDGVAGCGGVVVDVACVPTRGLRLAMPYHTCYPLFLYVFVCDATEHTRLQQRLGPVFTSVAVMAASSTCFVVWPLP